ncbi:hypothetical protein C1H46_015097 [Malus baccata]|uniref:Uncharacterized protein n=1 Tax=Malus baccata TaxID=106549 RepID=A0A540MKJ0_MALBA|nr:hypothetical protein C1H46_015097 [Malus baccata]
MLDKDEIAPPVGNANAGVRSVGEREERDDGLGGRAKQIKNSSPHIKKLVLLAAALQPIIGLLSSDCTESPREAALLLGQFAATDTDCKAHIVQRGALKPLIEMLKSPDAQIKEMSAFTLGRICLLASSDAFRAMFDGGYRERDAKDVVIPNIRWEVFELMDICVENLSLMFEFLEALNAMSLQQACILFLLEQFDKLVSRIGGLCDVISDIRAFFTTALQMPVEATSQQQAMA